MTIIKSRYKYFYCLILFIFLAGVQFAFASDRSQDFQNNLLKTDIRKNSLGAVKVTLYTSKPYSDPVVVNKKGNNEYVILLPETANSLTAKPSASSASDVVNNVVVKTQQYGPGVKGYTKMVISTTRPIEISPQVQHLNTSNYAMRDKDYSELMAQASKKTQNNVNNGTKQVKKVQSDKAALVKSSKVSSSKSVSVPRTSSEQIFKPTLASKTISKIKSIKDVVATKNKSDMANKAVDSQKRSRHEKISSEPQKEKASRPFAVKQVAVNEIKSKKVEEQTAKPIVKEPSDIVEPQQPSENINPTVSTAPAQKTEEVAQVPQAQENQGLNFKQMLKHNITIVFGGIVVLFLFLLLIARKMTKTMKKQKENFVNHLDEKPFDATNYEEKISDDMTWREKFNACIDTEESVSTEDSISEQASYDAGSTNSEIDNLFASEPDVADNESLYSSVIDDSIQEEYSILGDIDEFISSENFSSDFRNDPLSVEDVFGEDESSVNDEFVKSNFDDTSMSEVPQFMSSYANEEISDSFIEPESFVPFVQTVFAESNIPIAQETREEYDTEEIVKSEFVIGEEKGFYLVDFEDSTAFVGHIGDEIFVLKRFSSKINAPLQARIDEKQENSTKYMTRIGKFKGLVEVTSDKMDLLIEL